ncbi:MAG: methionine biosynthesis protein MetW [Pseudomonadales bacterium]|nr:methionine biosynthesis protein MetW [Pseudomonadales bacterium]
MRPDQTIIQQWINQNDRVLDLGCGDGSLLLQLKQQKDVYGLGIEIDQPEITECIRKGVNVVEQNLDHGLSNFKDNSFDTVIMSLALQAVRQPDQVLSEMLRIGKQVVVTFPNFGYWRCRLALAGKGTMPVSDFLPYTWYNTPNIHFCTIRDFEQLCKDKNYQILDHTVVDHDNQSSWWMRLYPNLLSEIAIYRLTR